MNTRRVKEENYVNPPRVYSPGTKYIILKIRQRSAAHNFSGSSHAVPFIDVFFDFFHRGCLTGIGHSISGMGNSIPSVERIRVGMGSCRWIVDRCGNSVCSVMP